MPASKYARNENAYIHTHTYIHKMPNRKIVVGGYVITIKISAARMSFHEGVCIIYSAVAPVVPVRCCLCGMWCYSPNTPFHFIFPSIFK